jgi:hypothetical protein
MRAAILLAGLLAAAPAFAQVGVSGSTYTLKPPPSYESPQRFAFEIKFGPYVPGIDSSPGLNGRTPFADLFNGGEKPAGFLLTTLEFDYQFFRKVGSLAVGLSLGYYRNTTKAFTYLEDMGGGLTPCKVTTCQQSGDETALNIIPIQLLLVYRFDYLMQRYRIPFVPYMKVGLGYYIWAIQNGSGGIATFDEGGGNTSDGAGGTWGFTLQPGLSFLLDIIDRNAAHVMDAELGINHTHLFIEMNYMNASNFGRESNTLVLSDLSFNAGLAFEF